MIRLEVMWDILENVIMGTIPNYLKSCLINNGFTSIKIISQINDVDIDNLDDSLREHHNELKSLKAGDRKLLNSLPDLIRGNQDDISKQWQERMIAFKPLSYSQQERVVKNSSDFGELQRDIDASSDLDVKTDRSENVQGIRSTSDEHRYEMELKKQLNCMMRTDLGNSAIKVDKAVVRVIGKRISTFCLCPMCNRKVIISARPRKTAGELSFATYNFKRHYLKSCKYVNALGNDKHGSTQIQVLNKVDEYWVPNDNDPLSDK